MTFRNNVAAFLWVFSSIFLLLVAAMTYVFIRNGTPFGYPPIIVTGALALLWIGAVGLTALLHEQTLPSCHRPIRFTCLHYMAIPVQEARKNGGANRHRSCNSG